MKPLDPRLLRHSAAARGYLAVTVGLGLAATGYGALCACAAGYRSADDKYAGLPKVRFKPHDVIVHA